MATGLQQEYYNGQGKVFLGEVKDGKKYNIQWVGNVSELTTQINTEDLVHRESYSGRRQKDLKFYTNPEGMFNATFENFQTDNLARVLSGLVTTIAAAAVTDEPHSAKKGGYIQLGHINIDTLTSLTDETGATTYTEDTDYKVNLKTGLIEILLDGTIPDSADETANIHANYSHSGSDRVQALTNLSKEYCFIFEGLNTIRDDSPVVVTAHRVSVSPAQAIEWITNANEVADFPVEVEVLYDDCQDDINDRFFRVDKLAVAA